MLELERLLLANKSAIGSIAAVTDPTTFKAGKEITKVSSDAGAGFLFEGGRANGFPITATTNCPADTIVFGNWEDLLFAQWGAVALAADPYTNFGFRQCSDTGHVAGGHRRTAHCIVCG